MTTTVIINAHCAPEKQVVINITDGDAEPEEFTIQDGESEERVVYDERVIHVKEVEK